MTTALAVLGEAAGRIRRLTTDNGYDADWLRAELREKSITPDIPGKRDRKRKIRHNKRRYRERWRIEANISCLKDFRRVATRYDKLARNDASACALAAVIALQSNLQSLGDEPSRFTPNPHHQIRGPNTQCLPPTRLG